MFNKQETVGLILAYNKPLSIYGNITAIRRLTLAIRKASVEPIIIVTGKQSFEVEHSMSDFGVIFIRGEDHQAVSEADYIRIGLEAAKGLFKHGIIASTEYPLISPDTIKQLLHHQEGITVTKALDLPAYPVGIDNPGMNTVTSLGGFDFFHQGEIPIRYEDTKDPGVYTNKKDDRVGELIMAHDKMLLQPYTTTCIETEKFFFDKRILLLMNLIDEFSSVKKACGHMAISYAKAWDALNNLEHILGYQVIHRSHGGARGGKTTLTPAGKRFISLYEEYNMRVKKYSSDCFFQMFPEFWENRSE